MPTATHPNRERNAGFVLVSVLWILAILTVMSLGFAGRAMLERRMAWYAADREQAQHLARAAAERGIFELRNKVLIDDYYEQNGYTGLDQRWARRIDLFAEAPYFAAAAELAEGDVCEVRIEDVESRISLEFARPEVLEGLEILDDRTISRMLERRDASTDGYQRAFFYSVEELRDMQEFDDAEWRGEAGSPGLAGRLTVGGDPALGQINVNTASAEVLLALPDMEPETVQAILELRNGADGLPHTADDLAFGSVTELSSKLDISAEKLLGVVQYCKANSRFFTIKAHASRRRGKINAYCTVTVELNGATAFVREWREGALGASS